MGKSDEFTVMEKILLDLQNNGKLTNKEILTTIIGYRDYRPLKMLEHLGLIKRKGSWGSEIVLLKIENNGGKIDILSYLKILRHFGLTNTDMKIIWAKGVSPEEIAEETKLPVNVVRQHETNIFTRLGVGTLKGARIRLRMELASLKEKVLA